MYLPLRNVNLGQGGNGEMITTPVTWFVLTHPRGNVIFDGGNAAAVAVDAKKHWGVITEMSTPFMEPEQAVLPSLERIGVDPASVRWIVQSHLHLDHTGALADIHHFPNAQVLATRTEYEWAHLPEAFNALAYCQADYVKPGIDWVLLEESDDGWDLFGDGVVRCGGRRPLAGSPVLRGRPAQREGVRPRLRRGEHDRPSEREALARVHHLRRRDRAVGAQAAAARVARQRDRRREPRPRSVAGVPAGPRVLRLKEQ